MKQVNMWIPDDIHMLLVKEAAKRMLQDGIDIRPSKMAALIITQHLNGSSETPSTYIPEDDEQDDEQDTNPFASLEI